MSASPSFANPKLEPRATAAGLGMFCLAPIARGEVLAVFGGTVCTLADLDTRFREQRHLSVQVEDGLYLVPERGGPGDYFNHSCDPNAGVRGQITLVAMRDISVGEQVCYDYAMTDGSPYDEFDCRCGAKACRGRVTGDDWKLPELRERYGGYFSAYLRGRMLVRPIV